MLYSVNVYSQELQEMKHRASEEKQTLKYIYVSMFTHIYIYMCVSIYTINKL